MSESGSFLKQFDIFKKMPKDLTEPTFCGAFVSVVCTIILFALTIYEFQVQLDPTSSSSIVFDETHRDDLIDVNIEIHFPKVPCGVMSLDVQDILGTHKLDV